MRQLYLQLGRFSAISILALFATFSVANALQAVQTFNISAQPLSKALLEFSVQSDTVVTVPPGLVEGKRAPQVKGEMSTQEALEKLLEGSGLRYETGQQGGVIIQLAQVASDTQAKSDGIVREKEKRIIEEVIVTAQKREQSLYDVPISILAFSSEELKSRKLTGFKDLALTVPGLFVEDSSVTRYIFMRGLGNISGSTSMVGIYLDEASVAVGGLNSQLDLPIFDLERVEVLRGPQGTLYGKGAMAGVIRYITKDPQLDAFGFDANVAASFTKDGAPGQNIQAVANVPLIENELGVRIAGTFQHEGGWIDQPIGEQKDINDQNLANLRVKALWQIADGFKANGMAIVHRNEGGLSYEQDDGNKTPAFDVLTPGSFEDEYEVYNLTLNYRTDNIDIISASNYVNAEKQLRRVPTLIRPPFFTADALLDPYASSSKTFSQEIRVSSNHDSRWQWMLGGFYEDWVFDGVSELFFGAPGPAPVLPLVTANDRFTSDSWAVFANTSFELTPRLEVGGGLRYFEDKRERKDRIANLSISDSFDTINPRVYLNYDLTDDVMVYSSVAKGFRSGGQAQATGGTFEPDYVWTYELGAKGSLFDGRLRGDIGIFYTEYSDVVMRLIPPNFTFSFDTNAGDAEIIGVEWSFELQASRDLRLGFSGTYLDTEYKTVIGTQAPKSPGDPIDFVQDYQFGVWVEQAFALADRPGAIRLDYNQQGPASNINRSFPFFFESEVINMLNFRMTWQWADNQEIGVFAQNLLNDRGAVEPIGASLGDGVRDAGRSRPRTIGVEFGVSF